MPWAVVPIRVAAARPHRPCVDWWTAPPWRRLIPVGTVAVGVGATLVTRLVRAVRRRRWSRDLPGEPFDGRHDEQFTVAAVLGGDLVLRRRLGGLNLPTVESVFAGVPVDTG